MIKVIFKLKHDTNNSYVPEQVYRAGTHLKGKGLWEFLINFML